jgi:ABC-type multidrug transport system permease subunit
MYCFLSQATCFGSYKEPSSGLYQEILNTIVWYKITRYRITRYPYNSTICKSCVKLEIGSVIYGINYLMSLIFFQMRYIWLLVLILVLTLSLLSHKNMELLVKPEILTSYMYGPTFGNAERHLFLSAAQRFNMESMQKVFLCHSCM